MTPATIATTTLAASNLATASAAFLLAFPALFSIVNPIAGAFIFREATADRSHAGRVRLARKVGVYSLLVMLVALWAGSTVLMVFGISVAALRIAGGLVLSLFAWELLGAPEKREDRKAQQTEGTAARDVDEIAFFPLTMPFTTGPGTIAVSVALGAGHTVQAGQDGGPGGGLWFLAGASLAAAALALVITLVYAFADRLSAALGRTGSRTVTRLSAFLLFCIGIQVLITGVTDALLPLLHG